jgi:hypothetical protein
LKGLFSVVGLHQVLACVDFMHYLKKFSKDIHIKEDVINDENSGTSLLRRVDDSGNFVLGEAIDTFLL